ncbi:MAG: exo-alpha-sialidase [Lentisphaeria bacterium]|nr:exo-alpha-sialidase [Lentisphaeria bacterium]
MKLFAVLGAVLATAGVASANQVRSDYGSVTYNGFKVKPVAITMVQASNEPLNFCFATRFPDNSIYLNHSGGVHTVSEYSCRDYSLDNGKTWQKSPFFFGGFNAYYSKDGKKKQVECWSDKVSDVQTIFIKTLNPDNSISVEKTEIKLPYKGTFRLHREIIRTKDDRLLLCGYSLKENAKKIHSFVIESKDDGKTWSYLSTILEDPEGKYPEGPNESTVVELANGDILAYVRVASVAPLKQLRSTDGGRTWSAPKDIVPVCVAPSARILENGTLVLITGRPNLYLFIDPTGTGENYVQHPIYEHIGSSYASVLEIEPNRVMVIYDESDFGAGNKPGIFNRIMAVILDIMKDDSLKYEKINHPEEKKYKYFYMPMTGRSPEDGNIYRQYFYKETDGTSFQVQEIAERPHPVLNLKQYGKSDKMARFCHFMGTFNLQNDAIAIGFEVRLRDAATAKGQFNVAYSFPSKLGEKAKYLSFAIGRDKIYYFDNGKPRSVDFDMGVLHFKSFEVKTSLAEGTYSVYELGKNTPIFTAALGLSNPAETSIFRWGDGSSLNEGEVDVAYVGIGEWKK